MTRKLLFFAVGLLYRHSATWHYLNDTETLNKKLQNNISKNLLDLTNEIIYLRSALTIICYTTNLNGYLISNILIFLLFSEWMESVPINNQVCI